MDIYINAEHILAYLDEGKVKSLDVTASAQAERHLEQMFPLRSWGTIIDWDQIPSTMIEWNMHSDDEIVRWVMSTMIGCSVFGLLLYDPTQPCLIGPLDFMVRHLDELVWKAPGCRILFGADRDENGQVVLGRGVIEFNGKGELFATTAE